MSAPSIQSGLPGLDAITERLRERKSCLVYGNAGLGKTAFALSFLHDGLLRGERCALITGRLPKAVFEQAEAFGLDLDPHFRDRRLLVFEYPENVLENSARLLDDSRIAAELCELLGAEAVGRLAFDPLMPLLGGLPPAAALARASNLVQRFDELEATCLYILGLPEGEKYAKELKDLFDAVLCLESVPGGPRRLRVERFPGLNGSGREIRYDIRAGIGLVDASPAAPLAGFRSNGHGVLIVDTDAERRQAIRASLEAGYAVIEAEDAAEGLALTVSGSPAVLVLAQELHGITGTEIARKMRRNGRSTPVVLLGDRLKRTADHVSAMALGVDVCLQTPIDARLLRLHISNLVRRGANGAVANGGVALPPDRGAMPCTRDLDWFAACAGREAAYAAASAVPFLLLAFQMPSSRRLDELSAVTAMVARSTDLTFLGERGVAVLLPEANDPEPFLTRFRQRWKPDPAPLVDVCYYDGRANFGDVARQFVEESVGSQTPAVQIRHAAAGLGGDDSAQERGRSQ